MARGRPKGQESQAILERRMKVLALRRDGRTMAAAAGALEVSVSAVVGDVKWLREQGYDLGEGRTSPPPPPGAVEMRQLRAVAADDDQATTRREVCDRRIKGESILMISIAMRITAHEVRHYLYEANRIAAESDTEARRELQYARLEHLLIMLAPGIEEGNPKAINAAARVNAEINRLGGLYRPILVEHTVITVDAIDNEIARLTQQLNGLRSGHSIEGVFELSDADE